MATPNPSQIQEAPTCLCRWRVETSQKKEFPITETFLPDLPLNYWSQYVLHKSLDGVLYPPPGPIRSVQQLLHDTGLNPEPTHSFSEYVAWRKFKSNDKNRPTIDDSEGPRDEPKGRLFEVQREALLWKTALETSLHKLQMVRSSMRDRCIAQQKISLKNCADRLPTCGVKTLKWQEVP